MDIVADVALMHMIRCQALAAEPAERYEYQAAAPLFTLVALLDADRVAPQMREVVDAALEQGAPTEVEPAAQWALDSYAALLDIDASRTESPEVLDAAIMIRLRVVDAMPPDNSGNAGARTDLEMLYIRRFDACGDVEDLDHAIERLWQAGAHAHREDQRAEAHRLLGIVSDHRASLARDEK
ncbi:hypothetical protein [Nonomuraea sp. SYSU D8015]|uniref:hypothetical protein n=1 Tax=Nonomuraea sp. SYSU D8015 TaxID=2593644 RepID=UPI0016608DC6|nr:hypothetical protein [Nonomuraea sp. SYSU D8015]